MKFCKHCGNELAAEAKFCKHCGQSVVSENKQSENAPTGDDAKQTIENGQANSFQEKDSQEEAEDQGGTLKEEDPVSDEPAGESNVPKQPNAGSARNEGGLADGAAKAKRTSGQPRKKISMKAKLFISITAALIIVLFVGYKVGGSLTSHQKMIEKFEAALIDQDAKEIASILKSSSKNLTIDKSSVQGFIDYYSDNPSEMDYLIDHLKRQGNEYENNPDVAEAAGDSEYYAVNLVKDGKVFIYDNYDIQISPVYFNVYTNYKDTEILLDGEVIATADTDDFTKEVGPFIPGTYAFTASYKSDFVELTTEAERAHFDPGYQEDVDLYIDGEEVEFYVPYEDGLESVQLFLNGEDTGIDLVEQNVIGPVLLDGSMTASFAGEFPWGTITTEEVPMESNYMDVGFKADDALKQTLQDKIVQFNQENIIVQTTADASEFTTASEQVVEDIVDQAEYDKKYDSYYQGKFIGIDFYSESFTIENYGEGWYISVDTNTIYEEDDYYDPEDDDAKLEETNEERGYELQYDNDSGEWFVTYIGWAGSMEDDKMIEYREEDPQVYTSAWVDGKDGKDKD